MDQLISTVWRIRQKPRIAVSVVAISAGSVIAREQCSPIHMKIAFGADLSFACAGCDAGKSFASVTRSTILSTNGNFNAVPYGWLRALSRHHGFGAAQAKIQRIEKRNVAKHVSLGCRREGFLRSTDRPSPRGLPVRAARRTRFCAATAFEFESHRPALNEDATASRTRRPAGTSRYLDRHSVHRMRFAR